MKKHILIIGKLGRDFVESYKVNASLLKPIDKSAPSVYKDNINYSHEGKIHGTSTDKSKIRNR